MDFNSRHKPTDNAIDLCRVFRRKLNSMPDTLSQFCNNLYLEVVFVYLCTAVSRTQYSIIVVYDSIT